MAREQLLDSYLATASMLVEQYAGSPPLHYYLKGYFSMHRNLGSRDRKNITQLVYSFYRMGHAFKNLPVRERIILSLFLTSTKPNAMLDHFNAAWNENVSCPLDEKMRLIPPPFSPEEIFPWKNFISDGIDFRRFAYAHLVQPDLFLRIRPGYREEVLKKLAEKAVLFTECAEDCLALQNTTNVEEILQVNHEVVVQDYSSQKIKGFFEMAKESLPPGRVWKCWDCCAASGGKAILASDVLRDIELTVSDIRPSILRNLRQRFHEAGINRFHSFVCDLSNHQPHGAYGGYDLIVADVPCSGSGTWSRTPEQLFFFDPARIEEYSARQQKIVSNTIPLLAKDGMFLYITCSVFKQENEDMVRFIRDHFGLEPLKVALLEGYDKKADTLYAALFRQKQAGR